MYHPISRKMPVIGRKSEGSRSVMHGALDCCLSPMALCDLDTRLNYVNKAFLNLLGYQSPGEVLGMLLADFWLDKDKVGQAVEALRGGRGWTGELRACRIDNAKPEVYASMSMVSDGNGAPICMVGSFTDITERRRAEERLRESEARLSGVLSSMDDLVNVLDAEGRLTDFYHAPEGYEYSVEPKDFVGRLAWEAFAAPTGSPIRECFRRCRDGRTAECEYALPKKAGPRWYSVKFSPIILGGAFRGAVAVSRDVTETRRSERQAREAARHWLATFNSLNDGVALLDVDGRVLRCNRVLLAQCGKTQESVIRSLCQDIFSFVPEPDQTCPFRRMLASKRREVEAFGKDGRWFEVVVDPVFDDGGALHGAVFVTKDITERRRAQDTLAQTRKLASIGQLAAGVAHEINNPLSALSGELQLLRSRVRDGELAESVLFMGKVADRIARIVTGLLAFSREGPSEVRERTDINGLLDGTLELMERRFERSRVEVERKFAKRLPGVVLDRGRVGQVFANVLLNSLDAMPDGGRLTVSTRLDRAGEAVLVVIEDTGCGIGSGDLPRVFDPFFTTKPPGKGTGLGLSISHGILASHGGRIELDSVRGRGTRVSIELPLKPKGGV